jgi:hypothetical protein
VIDWIFKDLYEMERGDKLLVEPLIAPSCFHRSAFQNLLFSCALCLMWTRSKPPWRRSLLTVTSPVDRSFPWHAEPRVLRDASLMCHLSSWGRANGPLQFRVSRRPNRRRSAGRHVSRGHQQPASSSFRLKLKIQALSVFLNLSAIAYHFTGGRRTRGLLL